MASYVVYSIIPPLSQGNQGKYKVVKCNNFQICICEVSWTINDVYQVKISQRAAPNTTNQVTTTETNNPLNKLNMQQT
jgi:hypothetical protein